MSNVDFLRKAVVKVPQRSMFDKSFKNLFTAKVGHLVPILCDEVIPNTKVDLKVALNACLPPLASDTFMNVDLCVESFFVPSRLLVGSFTSWMTGEKLYDPNDASFKDTGIPHLRYDYGSRSKFVAGTLADYLGYKLTVADESFLGQNAQSGTTQRFNVLPFLAYHRVYDDWYRNTLVQNPLFVKPTSSSSGVFGLSYSPYLNYFSNTVYFSLNSQFIDSSTLGDLRSRNFGADYFTIATPSAQNGQAQKVSIDTGQTNTFSISSLRAANSLQQFLERNNLIGFKWQDYVHGQYGANLSSGVAQRTIFLGSAKLPVYSKGVYASGVPAQNTGATQNPFLSVGAEYGSGNANGVLHLIDNFTADEPGYVMVIASLVPKVTYASGVLRQNMHYTVAGSQVDMANPLLQNTGNQPVYVGELNAVDAILQPASVFGYTDKYAEFMTREDELHGLVRDGKSLQSFALQRSFTNGQAAINTSFLKIPTNYMDQVTVIAGNISNYGYWCDAYFDYKVAQPLARYSLPSLQDPSYEHGEDVVVRRGGSRID